MLFNLCTIACLLFAPNVSFVDSHHLPLCPPSTPVDIMGSTVASPLMDVLIIGGGPAGLAVATGLARQLYTAVVFDSGVYRNALTKHMHNVPTWDHRDPAEFRAKAKSDLLARYSTVQFEQTKIESIIRVQHGRFQATGSDGRTWTGRKLVLASGMTDVAPDIKGYASCWAQGMYVVTSTLPFSSRIKPWQIANPVLQTATTASSVTDTRTRASPLPASSPLATLVTSGALCTWPEWPSA